MGGFCKYLAGVCPLLLAVTWFQVGWAQEPARSSQCGLEQRPRAAQATAQLRELNLTVSEEVFVTCAARGNARAIELFLAAGLSPNSRNRDGFTPLIWAAGQGHTQIVQTLLENGADVNAKSSDATTTLMAAASQGQVGAIELLLNRGAEIEAQRADGWTPLIWAAAVGQNRSVDTLIARGANIEARDADGNTALVYASANLTDENPNGETLPVV